MIRQKIIKINKVKEQRKLKVNKKNNNKIFTKDKNTKQKTLESHGFKNIIKVRVKSNQSINKSYSQTYLPPTKEIKDNEPQREIMTTKCEQYVRLLYININGLNVSKKGHSWLQLCLSLEEKGVNAICLTETNVNWKKQHILNSFTKTLKDTWPKEK